MGFNCYTNISILMQFLQVIVDVFVVVYLCCCSYKNMLYIMFFYVGLVLLVGFLSCIFMTALYVFVFMECFTYSDYRKNGFDTRRRKDGGFNVWTKKDANMQEPKPSAQSTILCRGGIDWVTAFSELRGLIESLRVKSPIEYNIFMIMLYSGCRVSEISSIKKSDVIDNQLVKISALKGSDSRIVNVPGLTVDKMPCWSNDSLLFEGYSRYMLYKSSIRYGFHKIAKGKFERIPTKLFRYCYASMLYQRFNDYELVGRQIGHKNVENAKYYIFELKGQVPLNRMRK